MLEARNYQERIHKKSLEYISQRICSKSNKTATLLLESPTGSGKTVMGQRLAKEYACDYEIVWMAHRTELRKQAEKTNEKFFGIECFNTISMFDKTPERFSGKKVLLVIDECQHSPANSALNIVNSIQPRIIIGLTATPYRTDRAKLLFEKVIKDAGIRQLIREGYLAPFDHWMANFEWTPQNVAEMYMKGNWGPSVSYFHRISDAEEMTKILEKNGFKAATITGTSTREEILDAFDKGEINHLSNCEVLTEGFDAPKLKSVFIRPGSRGPTIQMAGRVLRKHESTPITNIVQNIDTKFAFTKHANAHKQLVQTEGKWQSIDKKDIEPIVRQVKIAKSQIRSSLPNLLRQ